MTTKSNPVTGVSLILDVDTLSIAENKYGNTMFDLNTLTEEQKNIITTWGVLNGYVSERLVNLPGMVVSFLLPTEILFESVSGVITQNDVFGALAEAYVTEEYNLSAISHWK